jgi:hypothetical protein
LSPSSSSSSLSSVSTPRFEQLPFQISTNNTVNANSSSSLPSSSSSKSSTLFTAKVEVQLLNNSVKTYTCPFKSSAGKHWTELDNFVHGKVPNCDFTYQYCCNSTNGVCLVLVLDYWFCLGFVATSLLICFSSSLLAGLDVS